MNKNSENRVNKRMARVASITLMAGICATSIFSVRSFAKEVYVNVDSNTMHTFTLETDTDKILDKFGVKVYDKDVVEKIDDLDGSIKLNVKRAFDVKVIDGNNEVALKMHEGSVKDAIEASGLTLSGHDISNFDLNKALEKDMKIVITRRFKVIVSVDGEKREYIVPKGTVKNALNYMRVKLSSDDIVNLDLSGNVYENMEIVINRITFDETTYTEAIPYTKITESTASLEKGTEKVKTQGVEGERKIKVRKKFKDGELLNSEEIENVVVREAVNEVVLKGTKEKEKVSVTSKKENKPSSCETTKQIFGSATAYTASAGARTSTGKIPKAGETVAVNPKIIPYGSKILVEAVDGSFKKTFVAQDTGGALKSGSAVVDIYMNSLSSCKAFGRKQVKVSIIK